jgi:hypothetical protein
MSGYRQYDAQKVAHRISHGHRIVALSLSREIHHLVGESRNGLIFVDHPRNSLLSTSNSSCSRFADANFRVGVQII